MINLRKVTSVDSESYRFIENLLVASFPVEEYRELEQLREYTEKKSRFCNNIVEEDGKMIGLISYWDMESFIYVEHFAIDPGCRNGGYGGKVLNLLKEQLNHPVMVLEVEMPEEEMAIRRIGFYQRLGYQLWEREYFQPPYREGFSQLPMYLMVQGELDMNEAFEMVKQKIHTEVYGIKKGAY